MGEFIGRSRRMGRTDFSRAGVVNDEKDSEEGSLFSRGRGREEKSRPSRLKRRGDFGGIPESKRGEENVRGGREKSSRCYVQTTVRREDVQKEIGWILSYR